MKDSAFQDQSPCCLLFLFSEVQSGRSENYMVKHSCLHFLSS